MTWVSSDILKASSILLNLVVWNLNILKKKIERKKKKTPKTPPTNLSKQPNILLEKQRTWFSL